ncbi:hypothetical protein [Corynebacterium ulceribovis]|uniref:hypothetical protein n=1 Tax=Corynebacterium ulceribovis TaxID=487732 RepID=UPI0004761D95|nr:hypothetical protein [Corynebacterium ulceribovis]
MEIGQLVQTDAQRRLRETTQELYDIADEVAEYINHIAQSIADWDPELLDDCIDELTDIVDEGVDDARRALTEVLSLRRALTAGLRSGMLSAGRSPARAFYKLPAQLTVADLHAVGRAPEQPVPIGTLDALLRARTQLTITYLNDLAQWIISAVGAGIADPENAQPMRQLAGAGRRAMEAAAAWKVSVAEANPQYTEAMTGHNPPEFLGERIRVDAVVARVIAKRRQEDSDGFVG